MGTDQALSSPQPAQPKVHDQGRAQAYGDGHMEQRSKKSQYCQQTINDQHVHEGRHIFCEDAIVNNLLAEEGKNRVQTRDNDDRDQALRDPQLERGGHFELATDLTLRAMPLSGPDVPLCVLE